jgi:anti-anti-sigma regulatory factor
MLHATKGPVQALAPQTLPVNAVALFEVIIREDLSGSAAFELAETIASLPLDRVDGVRLTFRATARIDVTGVAVLVRLYSRLNASGKELVLGDAPPEIVSTLDALGLSAMLVQRLPMRPRWTRALVRAQV